MKKLKFEQIMSKLVKLNSQDEDLLGVLIVLKKNGKKIRKKNHFRDYRFLKNSKGYFFQYTKDHRDRTFGDEGELKRITKENLIEIKIERVRNFAQYYIDFEFKTKNSKLLKLEY